MHSLSGLRKLVLHGIALLFTVAALRAQSDVTVGPVTYTTTQTVTASNSITTTGTVTVASGANVTFQAGAVIDLTSGFSVASGGVFDGVTTGSVANVLPSFTTQPVSITVNAGAVATFSAAAAGVPAPTYQWYKNGTAIAGATSANYSISSAGVSDAGNYTVVAANSVGSVTSSTAVLTVNVAPTITLQPGNVAINAGQSATFSVSATGLPAPTYQWLRNGVAINGASSASFTINNSQPADAGNYSVVISNAAGSVTSATATLSVYLVPTITVQPVSASVSSGASASFSVAASGSPVPSYQWYKNGAAISGATQSTYSIPTVQSSDAGNYYAVASSLAGAATSNTASLTVNTTPTITTQPASQTIVAGNSVTFTVVAAGSVPLTYQWRKNGVSIAGATASSYSTGAVQSTDAAQYSVVVSNAAGSVTSNTATLTVTAPPVITTQPVSAYVLPGQTATFSVVATGTPAPTYQWYMGNGGSGSAISGATSASYTAPGAASGAAEYWVVVHNGIGADVISVHATWVVLAAPQFNIDTVQGRDNIYIACDYEGNSANLLLDVSTDNSFSRYVSGFHDLNIAAGGFTVTGLWPNTVYYFRLRGTAGGVVSDYSSTMVARTQVILTADSYSPETAYVKPDGTLWRWGIYGVEAQSGDDTYTTVPVQTSGISNVGAVAIGNQRTFILHEGDPEGGQISAWGKGALGNGVVTTQWTSTPVYVRTATGDPIPDAIALVACFGNTAALTSSGLVYKWSATTPYAILVPGLTNVSAFTASTGMIYCLKSDGTVWRYDLVNNPYQVTGLSGVIGIAANADNTELVALMRDGTVRSVLYTYGNSVGTLVDRGLSNIVAVSCGEAHCLALRGDGTVWTWGFNDDGELGDGTNVTRASPVEVLVSSGVPLTGVIAIAGGTTHSAAALQDGTVWCWGDGGWGELGNDSYDPSYYAVESFMGIGTTPPPPPVALPATAISCGDFQANWAASAGALSYRLDISRSGYFTGVSTDGMLDVHVGNVTTSYVYTGTTLTGSTWYYRVRAVNASGSSINSNVMAVAIPGSPPNAPATTGLVNINTTAFTAAWSTSISATNYRLDVSTDSSFASYVAGYQNVSVGNVTTASVAGLSANTTYYYRVRGESALGIGGSSATVAVTTAPPAPGLNGVSSITVNGFTASWTAVAGATYYELSYGSTSTFTDAQTLVTSSTSWSLDGLPNGSYYYRVRGIRTDTPNAYGDYAVATSPVALAKRVYFAVSPTARPYTGSSMTANVVSTPYGVGYTANPTAGASGTAVGTYKFTATAATGSGYIGSSDLTWYIVKANQTISFPSIGTQLVTNIPTLSASATSGLPVTLKVLSGPAHLQGNQLIFTGRGVVQVQASQGGNGNYNAAAPVVQSIPVLLGTQAGSYQNTNNTGSVSYTIPVDNYNLRGQVGLGSLYATSFSLSVGNKTFLTGTSGSNDDTSVTLTFSNWRDWRNDNGVRGPTIDVTVRVSGAQGYGGYVTGPDGSSIQLSAYSPSVTYTIEVWNYGSNQGPVVFQAQGDQGGSGFADLAWDNEPVLLTGFGYDGPYDYNGARRDLHVVTTPLGGTVTATGTTYATDAGTYTADVTATGAYTGSGTVIWTIRKVAQSHPVTITASAQQANLGDAVTFTAAGGDGAGTYIWGGDASGMGATATVRFRDAGRTTGTVTVYRVGDRNYNDSNYNSPATSLTIPIVVPANPTLDSDHDGIPDYWENKYGLSATDSSDALQSKSGDGISNLAKYNLGLDPNQTYSSAGLIGSSLPADWTALATPDSSNTKVVGLTSGTLDVSPSGALTYTVPIWVVPGTAGMQPKLALNYSSQGGAGVLGFGWSLSGASAISRGPQTRAVDNNIHGVDYSADDRFYMDGQRLVSIGSGTYGADSTEYRTEIDSLTKVISYGSVGSGPASFKAWTKAGLIIEFGYTTDSAAEVVGLANHNEIATWAVNKISDTKGNYMTFTYTEDTTNGEQLLQRINYTGAGSMLPYASVVFEYEGRTDTFHGYAAGAKIARTQRLKRIKSYYGTSVVRTYTLDYTERTTVNSRSLLTAIEESDAAGEQYPRLNFEYEAPTGGWRQPYIPITPLRILSDDLVTEGAGFADLDGDGWIDFIHSKKNNDGLYSNNEVYMNSAAIWLPNAHHARNYALPEGTALSWVGRLDAGTRLIDLDGDGLPDVFCAYQYWDGSSNNVVMHNTGSGWENWPSALPPAGAYIARDDQANSGHMLIDINGDGLPDIVWNDGTSSGCYINNAKGQYVPGGPFWVSAPQWAPPFALMQNVSSGAQFIDVNGDGLPDLVQYGLSNGGIEAGVAINSSSGFGSNWSRVQVPSGTSYSSIVQQLGSVGVYLPPLILSKDGTGWSSSPLGTEVVDLNGDGLPDVIMSNPKLGYPLGSPAAYLNTGKGWVYSTDYVPPYGVALCGRTDGQDTDATGATLMDLNGDGLPDLAVYRADQPNVYYLNTGRGWGAQNTSYISGVDFKLPQALVNQDLTKPTGTQMYDLNGDGMIDSCNNNAKQGYIGPFYNSAKPTADRLTKVTNGFGVSSAVTYGLLTDLPTGTAQALYTKGTGAVYPDTDVIGPMVVVKTMKHDDGTGGTYDIDYHYGGLKSSYLRGSLGFQWTSTTDTRTGIVSTTSYRQDFPYIGMPYKIQTVTPDGKLLAESDTAYDMHTLNGGKSVLPYASIAVQKSYELPDDNGNQLFISSSCTTTTINDYGDALNVTVSSLDQNGNPDGFSKSTDSVYTEDTSNWFLGRLTSSTVTAMAPGKPTLTRSSAFIYDPVSGLLTTEIVEPKYDAQNNLVQSSHDMLKTVYTYDGFGNKQTATMTGWDVDQTGAIVMSTRSTSTYYDTKGRFPDHTVNAKGHREDYTYNQNLGVVETLTGPNGLTTSWDYDGFGTKIKETRSDNTTTTMQIKWVGTTTPAGAKYFVQTLTDGGAPSIVFHDSFGRSIQSLSIDGNGESIYQETVYDANGRTQKTSVPHRASGTVYWTETTRFDLLNRPLEVHTPDDNPAISAGYVVSTVAYKGLRTDATDAKGRVSCSVKNSQGWVVTTIRDLGGIGSTVTTDYDAFGNPISTTAGSVMVETSPGVLTPSATPVGSKTSFIYDSLGRKLCMQDADMGIWSYDYNSFGELIKQTDAKGQVTRMAYDVLGRLVFRRESEGDTNWLYDTANHTNQPNGYPATWQGKLTSVSSPDGYSEAYDYDAFGRVSDIAKQIDGKNYVLSQIYDSYSRPLVSIYPKGDGTGGAGFEAKNVYNSFGFVKEVRGTAPRADGTYPDLTLFWRADSYNVDGRVSGYTLGNGLMEDRMYSPATGRVYACATGLGATNNVQFFAYDYDAVGNVTLRDEQVTQRRDYFSQVGGSDGYDTLDRLLVHRVEINGGPASTTALSYDVNGNVLSKSDVGNYTYGYRAGPHAVTGVSGGLAGTQNYVYDANGNMMSGGGRAIDWTSFNQVRKITQGSYNTTFSFDASHERIKQVANGASGATTTLYLGALELITSGGGTEEKNYILTPTGRAAVYTTGTYALPDVKYFHDDSLGSISAVTNGAGIVIQRFVYDAWGRRTLADGRAVTSTNNGRVTRGYTDHEHLDDFGLIHMNGRVYDPLLARFISADPNIGGTYDAQGYNRYSYVENNPMNRTDPTGYFSLKEILPAIIAIIVAVVVLYCTAGTGAGFAEAIIHATFAHAVLAGAAAGFSSGFSGTLLNGGGLGTAFKAGLIGAATGAASAAIAYGIGQVFDKMYAAGTAAKDMTDPLIEGGRAIAHGVADGAMSEVEGGNFRSGFYSGTFSSAVSSFHSSIGGESMDLQHIAERTVFAALVGGTASALGGGKFANGATTAAFDHLFNHEMVNASRKTRYQIAVISSSARSEGGKLISGHAFLAVYDTVTKTETTYGLWPDDHEDIKAAGLDNGPKGSDIRKNFANDNPLFYKYQHWQYITDEQYGKLMQIVGKFQAWHDYSNCAGFVTSTYKAVTGTALPHAMVSTPRAIGDDIIKLNGGKPSNWFDPTPIGGGK